MGTQTIGIAVAIPDKVKAARKGLADEIFREVDHDLKNLDVRLQDRKDHNQLLDPDHFIIQRIIEELGLSDFGRSIDVDDKKQVAVMAIYYGHLEFVLAGIRSGITVDRSNRTHHERAFIKRLAELFACQTIRVYPEA